MRGLTSEEAFILQVASGQGGDVPWSFAPMSVVKLSHRALVVFVPTGKPPLTPGTEESYVELTNAGRMMLQLYRQGIR